MGNIISQIISSANGFSNEVLRPTTGLGRLGAYLGAASGAPLGSATMAAMRDDEQNRQRALEQQARTDEQRLRLLQAAKALQGNPHYWQTNNGSLAMVGQDGRPQLVYDDPTPKVSWLSADNGDGTKQLVPTLNGVPQIGSPVMAPQKARASTSPPSGAVDYLGKNPSLAAQFDAKYGAGAASRILGNGGAGTAGGGFR